MMKSNYCLLLSPFLLTLIFTVNMANAANDQSGLPTTPVMTESHAYTSWGEPVKYPSNYKHFSVASPKSKKGGQYKIGARGTFWTTNPFKVGVQAPGFINSLVFESLLITSPEEEGVFYGSVASRIIFPKDRSAVIFKIRKGARFHDGKPLTSVDVKFSIETFMDLKHPSYGTGLDKIKSVSSRKGFVEIKFVSAYQRELVKVIGGLPILPKHHYENEVGHLLKSDIEPLGSGPYKIKNFTFNRQIKFERVKDYWAKDLPHNKFRFNFDLVTVEYFSGSSAHFESFKKGDVWSYHEGTAMKWAQSYNFPGVEKGLVSKVHLKRQGPKHRYGFVFNLRKKKLQDINLRKAMTLVFNFDWMNETFFYKSYTRLDGYFDGTPFEGAELSGQELELIKKMDPLDKGVQTEFPRFNTPSSQTSWRGREAFKEAYDLLINNGYSISKKGSYLLNSKKEPVKIEILSSSASLNRIISGYVINLRKLGIQVEIRMVDRSHKTQVMGQYDYDITVAGSPVTFPPGVDLLSQFGSSSASQANGRNYMGLKSPFVDQLIENILQAKEVEALNTNVKILNRFLVDSYLMVPWWYGKHSRFAYWNDKYVRPDTPEPLRSASHIIDLWWATDSNKN